MSLSKRCGCRNRDRCDDPRYWRVQVNGERQSGNIDEFAAWHGEDDEARKPVRQKSVAKAWESRIRQAIRKGIDPTVPPTTRAVVAAGLTIGDYIASVYLPKHVDITKEMTDVGREDKRSKCRVLTALVGAMPFTALYTAEPLEAIKRVLRRQPGSDGAPLPGGTPRAHQLGTRLQRLHRGKSLRQEEQQVLETVRNRA